MEGGFQEVFKDLPLKCQGYFKSVTKKFKILVSTFYGCSVFKVYCCMSLIATTRAEGGLVKDTFESSFCLETFQQDVLKLQVILFRIVGICRDS